MDPAYVDEGWGILILELSVHSNDSRCHVSKYPLWLLWSNFAWHGPHLGHSFSVIPYWELFLHSSLLQDYFLVHRHVQLTSKTIIELLTLLSVEILSASWYVLYSIGLSEMYKGSADKGAIGAFAVRLNEWMYEWNRFLSFTSATTWLVVLKCKCPDSVFIVFICWCLIYVYPLHINTKC